MRPPQLAAGLPAGFGWVLIVTAGGLTSGASRAAGALSTALISPGCG